MVAHSVIEADVLWFFAPKKDVRNHGKAIKDRLFCVRLLSVAYMRVIGIWCLSFNMVAPFS